MDDSRYQLLQETSSLCADLLQASEEERRASAKEMEIRQEISNARNLINNLESIEKEAGNDYELKRQIVNECYARYQAAKANLDSIDQSAPVLTL